MFGIGRAIRKLPINATLAFVHPASWYDRRSNSQIENLRNVLDQKSVAVVGNAASLLQQHAGQAIDGHDIVVRMNRGKVVFPEHQGFRTDILTLACSLDDDTLSSLNPKYIICTTRKRSSIGFTVLNSHYPILFLPKRFYYGLKSQIGTKNPSTGLTTAYMVGSIFNPNSITLFGFDWMETKTFYKNDLISKWHDWDRERDMIGQWVSENRAQRSVFHVR